jgi:hypothetical protein
MTEPEWLGERIPTKLNEELELHGIESDRERRLLSAACANFPAQWSVQSDLIREIFGNPFRPITLDPSWLTSTVIALANGIYEEKAFDRMPILADALMDAGCDNEDILNHCRQPGEHCRGCLAVDLLLTKT